MGSGAPKFYGLPKINKLDTPLRPIVSSCGLVTYCVAKELTKILKPLVGKSFHPINGTQEFVEQVNKVTLLPGECISSYDVTALFTSVLVDPAPGIIKDLLEKRPHPQGKNSIISWGYNSPIGILPQKYILFFPRPVLWTGWRFSNGVPGKYHCSQPLHRVLWAKSSKYCTHPRLWHRYVDDTFVIQKRSK